MDTWDPRLGFYVIGFLSLFYFGGASLVGIFILEIVKSIVKKTKYKKSLKTIIWSLFAIEVLILFITLSPVIIPVYGLTPTIVYALIPPSLSTLYVLRVVGTL